MFDQFQYQKVALEAIQLDRKNPRLVTLKPLKTETQILEYLFEHEGLEKFLLKIASEGRNIGAERPYVVKAGSEFTVIEGNTRIAAYKLLTGKAQPPSGWATKVPKIDENQRKNLLEIECTVAPSRDSLLPIMASAHFGLGDKSKWGYLGSRKAVYDEWKSGKTIPALAKAFARPKGKIRDFILEYTLFLEALKQKWTPDEREKLEDPAVEFNPPIRFLQSQGHKDKLGVNLDREELMVEFEDDGAKEKFKHLVRKLVISPVKGLGATASYEKVFADFKPSVKKSGPKSDPETKKEPEKKPKLKAGALFNYPVTKHNQLLDVLAKEAADLNAKNFPAAGTYLLRNLIETVLRQIIDDKDANPKDEKLSLEKALNICTSAKVGLPQDDRKVLSEFRKSHMDYINLGAHGIVIPNSTRLFAARDCVDQFIKRNI